MKKTWIMLAAIFTLALAFTAIPSALASAETLAIQSDAASSSGQSAAKSLPKGMTPRTDVPDAVTPVIEVDNDNARLLVRYKASDNSEYMVAVTASDGSAEYYTLYAVNADEYFPLPNGNGAYQIMIVRKLEGNKVRVISKGNVTLKAKDQNAAYLSSSYYVNWEVATATQQFASQLTGGKQSKGGDAVATAVYESVVKTMGYDQSKLNSLPSYYAPELDPTLQTKMGVCFDISSLLAGMLRYEGIPTRLVMGYTKATGKTYHAWNEAFIDGKWVVIDATYDAEYEKGGHAYEMEKNPKDFQAVKVF